MNNLDPCPFCGGTNQRIEREVHVQPYGIRVVSETAKCSCGCQLHAEYSVFPDGKTYPETLQEKWNRRRRDVIIES